MWILVPTVAELSVGQAGSVSVHNCGHHCEATFSLSQGDASIAVTPFFWRCRECHK